MTDFVEVADRVWVARYPWCDVNVSVVAGSRGVVVIDTYGSTVAAAEVVDDVRRLAAGEVVALVNTHAHFDHTFGNHAFTRAFGDLPIHAHETARDELAAGQDEGPTGTEIVLPTHVFSSVAAIDLGDRGLELLNPGRGHTAGDLVAIVGDAGVVLTGDLVEESGPPAYGPDCWPLDWPLSLDLVLQLTTPTSVVVPGHGTPVDRRFVEDQRDGIGTVAETIRGLAQRGVPAAEALDAAQWPYPVAGLEHAVRRGYAQLPPDQRRLPLA